MSSVSDYASSMPDRERPLSGGRTTAGVVRIGETVRRPARNNSEFVRRLLTHLAAAGFEGAPRHLGVDGEGRELFGFVPGTVPDELDSTLPDDTLAAAARLIRRFHDATAGSDLAGSREVVCHGDLSPCNFVFEGGIPVAIIDFDAAAPGARLDDLGYALFLWLNLGTAAKPPSRSFERSSTRSAGRSTAWTPAPSRGGGNSFGGSTRTPTPWSNAPSSRGPSRAARP
jgi:Phosphotransferase enzyme family